MAKKETIKGFTIKGTRQVINSINKVAKDTEGNALKALLAVAVLIRRSMDKEEPKIPVDTGNLRQSWFVNSVKKLKGPEVTIGFSANYAVFVHEMVNSKFNNPVNWNREGGGPKFLQEAMQRNEKEAIQIIQKYTSL
jgi:hypothetical protein